MSGLLLRQTCVPSSRGSGTAVPSVHDASCQKVLVMKCQLPSLRKCWGFGDSPAITFLGQAGAWPLSLPSPGCPEPVQTWDEVPGSGEGDPGFPGAWQSGLHLGLLPSQGTPGPARARHSSRRWRSPAGV